MQQSNKTYKITLIALLAALILSIALSAVYLIPKYNLLNSGSPELVEETIDQALDHLMVQELISEFRLRNDGAYPSVQYLTETLSPDYPLFYDNIQIKSEDDNLSETAWPKFGELHIWPGYTCVDNENKYTASEINYEELIRQSAEEFATVSASVAEIIARGRDAGNAYSC